MRRRGDITNTLDASGTLRSLVDAFGLLTSSERRGAALLVASMNINAILGLVGLAGVIPFVHLMLEPAPLEGSGHLARTFRAFGFTDADAAIGAFGLALIAVVLLKNAYAYIHAGRQFRFCAKAESRLACELLNRVVSAPYGWLIGQNSSVLRDIVVGQSIEWSRGIIRTTLQLVNDLLFLLLAILLIVVASPLAGLVVSIAAAALSVGLAALAGPRIAKATEEKRSAIRLAGVTANEAICGGRDVRISGIEPVLVSSFARDVERYSNSDGKGRLWQMVPRLGIEVIAFAALVAIALSALWAGVPRAEIAGLLALFAVVAMRAIPVMGQLVTAATALRGALPAVAEIKWLKRALPPVPRPISTSPLPADWAKLQLEDIVFAYAGAAAPALGPLSLTITRGRSYGIVGSSGAGKSTLVDVLAALLKPTSGRMMLDDTEITSDCHASWRQRIAYVSQTPFLLDASLRDNVVFGELDLPDQEERLAEAIAAAGLSIVVAGLHDGLNAPLGERGIRLSGGQRQRVAIARALYRNAEILILDEATSALDSVTEREVSQSIQALAKRATVLCIAHRLSTVAACDTLIVMESGRVVAMGTHADLAARSPTYRKLAEAQELVAP
jgi:ABC-type multidrug transport system fused ATPase/permease subunit